MVETWEHVKKKIALALWMLEQEESNTYIMIFSCYDVTRIKDVR